VLLAILVRLLESDYENATKGANDRVEKAVVHSKKPPGGGFLPTTRGNSCR
jgi:hypothetical protein